MRGNVTRILVNATTTLLQLLLTEAARGPGMSRRDVVSVAVVVSAVVLMFIYLHLCGDDQREGMVVLVVLATVINIEEFDMKFEL